MNPYDNLTDEQIEGLNDLRVQAIMFDMDVDWEGLRLRPKTIYTRTWVDKWRDKLNESDYTVIDNGF